MLNKNERMAQLKANGVNVDKYFTVDLDNGTKIHLIIDENGNPIRVDRQEEDPILNQIIEDGYVRNTRLHRRFVMAQMFSMLNYVSYDGQYRGYNDCLKKMYGYGYTLKMMVEEVRVLCNLEVKDTESFNERVHFFDKATIVNVMEDYLEKLKAYIDKLPNHTCKGIPYKRIKGINIFEVDLNKKIYFPIRCEIDKIKHARNYTEVYHALTKLLGKKTFMKLPYDTPKSKAWIDAYKGAGAYYTLKNLVMFHNCTITATNGINYGVNSMVYLNSTLDAYKGEYYKMFALMNTVIADNGINTKTHIAEVCNFN